MADYNIGIWETQTLADNYGTDPQAYTDKYIEEAFKYTYNSVSTTLYGDYPQMYLDEDDSSQWQYEQYVLDGSSDVNIPCTNIVGEYNGIGYYFKGWLSCNNLLSDQHFHILLTAAHNQSGHTIHWDNGSVCVVEGGPYIPDAPWSFTRYEPKDDTTAKGVGLDAIQTTHHELGHALIHDDEDDHYDHKMGGMTKTDGNYYWVTPLGLDGGTVNDCGDSFDTQDYKRWDLVWSDCCIGEWESPPG